MDEKEIIVYLKKESRPANLEGMARFGINVDNALAVSIPTLRRLAKEIGKDHRLSLSLYKTNIHEARILCSMIDDPAKVTEAQMDSWAKDFVSWDLCDQVCSNLFDKTPFAKKKALEWCKREEEYVKRAGFVIMATSAIHNKEANDSYFLDFFPSLMEGSYDERTYVKKAVNWAIRQIGKRNSALRADTIALCRNFLSMESRSAKWIARDALRELDI